MMRNTNMKYKNGEIKNYFSIRKLSVGACSVLIGASLWLGWGNNETVFANSVDVNGDTVSQVDEDIIHTENNETLPQDDTTITQNHANKSTNENSTPETKPLDASRVANPSQTKQSARAVETGANNDLDSIDRQILYGGDKPVEEQKEIRDPNLMKIKDNLTDEEKSHNWKFDKGGHIQRKDADTDLLSARGKDEWPSEVIEYLNQHHFKNSGTWGKRDISIALPGENAKQYNQTGNWMDGIRMGTRTTKDGVGHVSVYFYNSKRKNGVDDDYVVYKKAHAEWDEYYDQNNLKKIDHFTNVQIEGLTDNDAVNSDIAVDAIPLKHYEGYRTWINIYQTGGLERNIYSDQDTEIPADYLDPDNYFTTYTVRYLPLWKTAETKTATRTIEFIDENGTKMKDELVQTNTAERFKYSTTGPNDTPTYTEWVLNGENTWKEMAVPQFDGYVATIDGQAVNEIPATEYDLENTPDKYQTSITVVYKKSQKASVTFIDDEYSLGKSNQVSIPESIHSQGASGEPIKFDNLTSDMQDLLDNGYELKSVQLGTNDPNGMYIILPKEINWDTLFGNYDSDSSSDQKFTIHLVHGRDKKTDNKTVTETIHYVYEDGITASPDYSKDVKFSRTKVTDKVTGKEITSESTEWAPASHTFDAVKSPTIDGYTPDKSQIDAQTVYPSSQNLEFTVTYKKNIEPPTVIPTPTPDPDQPKPDPDPDKPTDKDKPTSNTPQDDPKVPEQGKTETVQHYANKREQFKAIAAQKQEKAALPQTGAKKDELGIIGLSLAALGLLAGLGTYRKRDN